MIRWVGLLLLICLGASVAARAQWETPNRSFHKATAFPLEGRHLAVACESCHLNRVTKGTPTKCESCHWERRQDDIYRLRLGANCSQCHTPTSWTAVKWSHAAATGTALHGAHRTVPCASCHKNRQFVGTRTTCIECHRKDFERTTAPNHAAAGYSVACATCHRVSAPTWHGAVVNHSQFYPLVGRHALANCTSCHVNSVYAGTPRTCYGCHQTQYAKTTSPSHAAAGFGTSCDACHKSSDGAWTQGKFIHTAFPITNGRHAGIACTTCHTNATTYATFSCMNGCHNKTTTDEKHKGRTGYQYIATACYACHPQGRS
jgi:hypothetical protein